jgi:hypothetical protein
MKENGDVLTWIFATASATFSSNSNQKKGLVDKFRVALVGLENPVLYDGNVSTSHPYVSCEQRRLCSGPAQDRLSFGSGLLRFA